MKSIRKKRGKIGLTDGKKQSNRDKIRQDEVIWDKLNAKYNIGKI